MTISAALFDLDGTLVDSLGDLTDAVNHMLADFGRNQLEPAQVRQLVGKGVRNLVQRALVTDSPNEIERGLTAFTGFNTLHIADKSRLYPGTRELLQKLAAAGIRMAIISNKQEALSRLILKALKIDGYFEIIAGGDTFLEMKPSPLPVLQVIAQLGCSNAETVMVGDSINDIQAGISAGISTLGCRGGYGEPDELQGARYQADSPEEIFKLITTAVSS